MNKRARIFLLSAATVLLTTTYASAIVSFDWAHVGNAGNAADDSGFGSVMYDYQISKTEVSTEQYVEFLNAVARISDPNGLYSAEMSATYYPGITRTGSGTTQDQYVYTSNTNWENRPVVFVSWYDALRFANWMENGQPNTGIQDASTTEYGSYDMSQETIVRLPGAQYLLPNTDEWYKAAYYSPQGIYYDYATGSDITPDGNTPNNDSGNSANYIAESGDPVIGYPYFTNEVDDYALSASPYGTYNQNGNVSEWSETIFIQVPGQTIGIVRGGAWAFEKETLQAGELDEANDVVTANLENQLLGFRLINYLPYGGNPGDPGAGGTTVPEPASIGLLILSLSGLLMRRKK